MIVAYLRVSTSRQHIENQQEEIKRYALSQGVVIDRWEKEVVSGKIDRDNRKLGRLIRRLKAGDMLIVTELSRLSRTLHEIMQIMKHCIDHQIIVHSTKEGYTFDDSINSKVLGFAFGLTAEIERNLISQRTREAMAVGKAQGKHMGRRKGSGRKMQQLKEHRQEIIDTIAGGTSIGEVCHHYGVSYNTYYRFMKADTDGKN